MTETSMAHKFTSRIRFSLPPLVESRAKSTMMGAKTLAETGIVASTSSLMCMAHHAMFPKTAVVATN